MLRTCNQCRFARIDRDLHVHSMISEARADSLRNNLLGPRAGICAYTYMHAQIVLAQNKYRVTEAVQLSLEGHVHVIACHVLDSARQHS